MTEAFNQYAYSLFQSGKTNEQDMLKNIEWEGLDGNFFSELLLLSLVLGSGNVFR